jgi:hypothetical protein
MPTMIIGALPDCTQLLYRPANPLGNNKIQPEHAQGCRVFRKRFLKLPNHFYVQEDLP